MNRPPVKQHVTPVGASIFGVRPPDNAAQGSPLRSALTTSSWLGDAIKSLAALVGGIDALEVLEADPLLDEVFVWAGIADEVRPVARAILDAFDVGVDAEPFAGLAAMEAGFAARGQTVPLRIDIEHRTIVRRLLALLATTAPDALQRSSAQRTAAALTWLAMRSNDALGSGRRLPTDWLWRMFDVSNCADRGRALLAATGLPMVDAASPMSRRGSADVWLAHPALQHSRTRAGLLRQRDTLVALFQREAERLEAARPIRQVGNGQVQLRCRPVTPRWARRAIADSGQAVVAVTFGQSEDDVEVLALSVPDARLLIGFLERAMDAAFPALVSNVP